MIYIEIEDKNNKITKIPYSENNMTWARNVCKVFDKNIIWNPDIIRIEIAKGLRIPEHMFLRVI